MTVSCPECERRIDLSVCLEDGRTYLDIDLKPCDCEISDQELGSLLERAEFVVGAPAAPVRERVEPGEDLGLGGRARIGHRVPSIRAMMAA